MAGRRRSRAPLRLVAVSDSAAPSVPASPTDEREPEPESARFSEYQALVRKLSEETRARREGERAIMQRISDMRQALVAGNEEIWRAQRQGTKANNERLANLEGLVDRALGRVSHLSGGLEGQRDANKEQGEHLSRIDTAIGTILGQVGELKTALVSHPRRSSALWGAVGAPASLIVLGFCAWLLKRAGINVGWP